VQIKLRRELHDALEALGRCKNVVHRVVLDALPLEHWATSVGMHRSVALGYLSSALDVLCAFYAALA